MAGETESANHRGVCLLCVDFIERGSKVAYPVFIRDVQEDGLLVSFEDGWQPDKKVAFESCRFPPDDIQDDVQIGSDIEVLSQNSTTQGQGWWSARIKEMKGEFLVVDYTGWDKVYSDIVQFSRIRSKNTNLWLSRNMFYKWTLPIPKNLQVVCQYEDSQQDFAQILGKSSVSYDGDSSELVVLSLDPGMMKKADVLGEMHLKNLAQRTELRHRTEESLRLLQSLRAESTINPSFDVEPSLFVEEFALEGDLIGLAIGKSGGNINQARDVEGVVSVDILPGSTIRIRAQTQEAAVSARSILE